MEILLFKAGNAGWSPRKRRLRESKTTTDFFGLDGNYAQGVWLPVISLHILARLDYAWVGLESMFLACASTLKFCKLAMLHCCSTSIERYKRYYWGYTWFLFLRTIAVDWSFMLIDAWHHTIVVDLLCCMLVLEPEPIRWDIDGVVFVLDMKEDAMAIMAPWAQGAARTPQTLTEEQSKEEIRLTLETRGHVRSIGLLSLRKKKIDETCRATMAL